jgi:hypothetical protein
MTDEDVETFLTALRNRRFESQAEMLGAFLTATTMINTAWPALYEAGEPDRDARVGEWVESLWEAARSAAARFNADGFSISAGFPSAFSVTFEWKTA